MSTSRNKSIVILIEIIVTFIMFSFASAVLLQVFAKGAVISGKVKDKNSAVLKAESIIEQIKSTNGSDEELEESLKTIPMGNEFIIYFDENWQQTPAHGRYSARVSRRFEEGNIMSLEVAVFKKDELITSIMAKHFYPEVST